VVSMNVNKRFLGSEMHNLVQGIVHETEVKCVEYPPKEERYGHTNLDSQDVGASWHRF
jgi:hypothetical protein